MRDIQNTMRSLGITRCYTGYKQLHYAINLSVSNRTSKLTLRHLYTETAAYYGCKWTSVERNIRTLAARAWRINPALLSEMSGYPLTSAPSASELIELISAYVLEDTAQSEKYSSGS